MVAATLACFLPARCCFTALWSLVESAGCYACHARSQCDSACVARAAPAGFASRGALTRVSCESAVRAGLRAVAHFAVVAVLQSVARLTLDPASKDLHRHPDCKHRLQSHPHCYRFRSWQVSPSRPTRSSDSESVPTPLYVFAP